ncbi:hypothetical protein EDB19DRAFT_1913788 [Suillus lakei]|nr:hypothetical protein EDB19DRAFT_1913788 [Suillus lakei]
MANANRSWNTRGLLKKTRRSLHASEFLSGLRSEHSNPPRSAPEEPSCDQLRDVPEKQLRFHIPKTLFITEEGENEGFENAVGIGHPCTCRMVVAIARASVKKALMITSTVKAVEAGKSTRYRHVEITQNLEASFAWAPPLSTEPREADDLLAGPESILPDDVAAEFAALEELKRTKEVQSIGKVEVLEGNAFDFGELDRVEQGTIPQAILDEVEVVNYNSEGGGWDK